MTYTAEKPDLVPSSEELRARIPGWGADLDPADRPAVPRERRDLESGAHWDFPERQPETFPRERSIEHRFLTPVFGTSCPPRGVSGRVRRYAYARFSEGRAAHWLLLVAADRLDVLENRIAAVLAGRPDNLLAETGVRAELTHHGLRSRRGRTDVRHQALDPLIVGAPVVLAGLAVFLGARALSRRRAAAAG
jgi:hypothetical protein